MGVQHLRLETFYGAGNPRKRQRVEASLLAHVPHWYSVLRESSLQGRAERASQRYRSHIELLWVRGSQQVGGYPLGSTAAEIRNDMQHSYQRSLSCLLSEGASCVNHCRWSERAQPQWDPTRARTRASRTNVCASKPWRLLGCHKEIPSGARVSSRSVPNEGANKQISRGSNRFRFKVSFKPATGRSASRSLGWDTRARLLSIGVLLIGGRGRVSSRIVQLEREH